MIDLDIPDFLRATPENTAAARAAWKETKPKKRSKQKNRHRFDLPKTIDPTGLALLKQIEQEKKAKQKARFESLRARRR
jgi:hypothetical protein